MAATYQLRKYLRSQELADRPEEVKARAIRHEAGRRAANDRKVKFPMITSDNFEEADAYQRKRFEEWVKLLKERDVK